MSALGGHLTKQHWQGLSEDKRQQELQELENALADAEGRTAASVRKMEGDALGEYRHDENVIYVNKELLTRDDAQYDAQKTLFHESRHAYQYDVCDNATEKEPAETVSDWQANLPRFADDKLSDQRGYQAAGAGEEGLCYPFQPVEQDAENVSQDRMDAAHSGDVNYEAWKADEMAMVEAQKDAAGYELQAQLEESGCNLQEYAADRVHAQYQVNADSEKEPDSRPNKDKAAQREELANMSREIPDRPVSPDETTRSDDLEP